MGNSAFDSNVQINYRDEPLTASTNFEIDGTTLMGYTGNDAHVVIPSSVTIIYHHAFLQCYSLTSVTIPSSVSWIGGEAFGACENLTSVTFESPSSLNSIGEAAFASSGLTNITIPSSVTVIHDYAFNNTKLTNVTLSRGTEVPDSAFPDGVQINYRD